MTFPAPREGELDLATLDIASPAHYESNGYPHPGRYLKKVGRTVLFVLVLR